MTAGDLQARGAYVERAVLSRAVQWHAEDRVIRHGNSTIVFTGSQAPAAVEPHPVAEPVEAHQPTEALGRGIRPTTIHPTNREVPHGEESAGAARRPQRRRDAAQLADRGVHLPGGRAGIPNWSDEQKAWRDTAVLYDQSHHMVDVFIKGPDAIRLISDTAINSMATFAGPTARSNTWRRPPSGHVIGDGILFHVAENE